MVQRQSNIAEPTPPFFVRTLTGLEESVNTAISKDKASQKKTNAANAKAMTAMKQKIKKSLKEYETDVTKFKEVGIWAILFYFRLISCIQDPEAFEKAFALATAPKEVPTAPVRRAAADRTAEEEDDDDAFQQVGRGGRQYNFTTDSIYKNLQAIQEARGKKVRTLLGLHRLSYQLFRRTPIGQNRFVSSRNCLRWLSRLTNKFVSCFR